MFFESERAAYDIIAVCISIKTKEYTAIAVITLSSGNSLHMFFQFGAVLVNSRFVKVKSFFFIESDNVLYMSLSIFTSLVFNKTALMPLNIAEYSPSGTLPFPPQRGHGPDEQPVSDALLLPPTENPEAKTTPQAVLLHIVGNVGMFSLLQLTFLITGCMPAT